MAKLAVGDQAPEFGATTDDGRTVKLSDYKGKRVILYFYPKDDTPGCTAQACSFRDSYATIQEENAVVLGISPDDAKSHLRFKNKFGLPFPLLIDQDHQIAELYGAWGEKTMYGKKYQGIIRSHFAIDESGKLVDVQYNVNPRQSASLALAAIRVPA